MNKNIKLDELPTLAELDLKGVLNQADRFLFEEIDGKLVATWRDNVDCVFIVGNIEHRGAVKVVKHDGWIIAHNEGDGWELVDRELDLAALKTIADLDLDGILSQSSEYTPECFQEFDGRLVAMWGARWKDAPKHAFVVGNIESWGGYKEVKYKGKVVAIEVNGTGWSFVLKRNNRLKLEELPTIDEVNFKDILKKHTFNWECFEVINDHLVALPDADPYNAFIVGEVRRHGVNAEVRHKGKLVAEDSDGTGWRLIRPEEDESEV